MKKRIFVLIGTPGSGKGTQAELLKRKFNLKHYSVGSILRREISQKTKIGKQAEAFVNAGRLVPDNIISTVVFKRLNQDSTEIILDGFPRNLAQAKLLDKYLESKNRTIFILEINLSRKQMGQRVSGRLSCECGEIYHRDFKPPKKKGVCDICKKKLQIRSDSDMEVAQRRFVIYEKETKPVIKYYRLNQKKYYYRKIRGNQAIERVFEDILKAIK